MASKPASGGRLRYLDAEAQAWLVAYVEQQPDATLAEPGSPTAGGRWVKPASGKC